MKFVNFSLIHGGLWNVQTFENICEFAIDWICTREKTKYGELWHDGFLELSCFFIFKLAIRENEAAAVQWIFCRYLAGDSFGKIVAGPEKQDVRSPTGKEKMKNEDPFDKVLIQNHHVAIISVEDSRRLEEMKAERSKVPAQETCVIMSY